MQGVSTILSLFPGMAAFGAIGSFGLFAWQSEQQQKLENDVRQRVQVLDSTKLDRNFLESEDFLALVFQATEAVSTSASDVKRRNLANALVASVTIPTSQFSGKQTIIRLINQMSDEEMSALKALSQLEDNLLPDNNKQGISTKDIAGKLDWNTEDTIATCEGLIQLGLALDMEGVLFRTTGQFREIWGTTTLAQRVIKFSIRCP